MINPMFSILLFYHVSNDMYTGKSSPFLDIYSKTRFHFVINKKRRRGYPLLTVIIIFLLATLYKLVDFAVTIIVALPRPTTICGLVYKEAEIIPRIGDAALCAVAVRSYHPLS